MTTSPAFAITGVADSIGNFFCNKNERQLINDLYEVSHGAGAQA